MNISVIGGDRRFSEIANILNKSGFDTKLFGHGSKSELPNRTILILPVPVSRDNITVNAPLCDEKYGLNEIMDSNPKAVIGGLISKDFNKLCKYNNTKTFDYYKNEELTVKNANLTAEAAVAMATIKTDRAFYGANVLIIGYGRIGSRIAEILKTMEAKCTCTSRSDNKLSEIMKNGFNPLSTGKVIEDAYKYDYVFNTVPSTVMSKEFISALKPDCFVMDLATDSGTDFEWAKSTGRRVDAYPSLPARFSYLTAAEVLASEIVKILKENLLTEE